MFSRSSVLLLLALAIGSCALAPSLRSLVRLPGLASSSPSTSAFARVSASRSPPPVCQMRRRFNRDPPTPKDTTPINEDIEFESMRVLLDNPGGADEQLGVMTKEEALAAAEERDLDLVLIAAKSEPPICKIVSYDKFRFNKEKKKKEQAKAGKGQELKELKMSYKIGTHDYDVRKRAAEKFLLQGNKVKFSMQFRGREIVHADVGKAVMQRMAESLEDVGIVDAAPRVFGKQMIMTVGPKTKEAVLAAKARAEAA